MYYVLKGTGCFQKSLRIYDVLNGTSSSKGEVGLSDVQKGIRVTHGDTGEVWYAKGSRGVHRTRLTAASFADFLANIKLLNNGQQNRDQTLQAAKTLFGPSNQDLYGRQPAFGLLPLPQKSWQERVVSLCACECAHAFEHVPPGHGVC